MNVNIKKRSYITAIVTCYTNQMKKAITRIYILKKINKSDMAYYSHFIKGIGEMKCILQNLESKKYFLEIISIVN